MFECTEASQSTLPAHTTCDVAIVGYGPVGMTFAALLAQYGLKVIVVERFPQRYAQSRAGHFDGETMRTFQRIGIAESIELIARSNSARAAPAGRTATSHTNPRSRKSSMLALASSAFASIWE